MQQIVLTLLIIYGYGALFTWFRPSWFLLDLETSWKDLLEDKEVVEYINETGLVDSPKKFDNFVIIVRIFNCFAWPYYLICSTFTNNKKEEIKK